MVFHIVFVTGHWVFWR